MKKRILVCLALIGSATANAGNTGLTLTLPIIAKDPSGMHGSRIALWYQPESLKFKNLNIFFDVSYGYWWINSHVHNSSLSIYSIAPTVRFYFKNFGYFTPFIDLSIGASILSKTHFDGRNLGEHFSFQDQVGVGSYIGREQKITASLSAMHYSNGSLCKRNIGITIPLLFNIGYQFM